MQAAKSEGKESLSSCLGTPDCLLEERPKGPGKQHQSTDDTTSQKTCRHQVTTWLCFELLSFPSIPPAPHWSSRKRANLAFPRDVLREIRHLLTGTGPVPLLCRTDRWSGILLSGLFLLPSSALRLTQAARKLSHIALAMRALSCPAEQGVPALTQTLHQPPPPVMSLTCQKLCQLKHKGETAPK